MIQRFSWRLRLDRTVATSAVPPFAEEAADCGRHADPPSLGAGTAVPRGRLRDGTHLALPPGARRDLDKRRLRARPRPVGQAAGRRPGTPDRRPDGAVQVTHLRPRGGD